MFKKLIATFIFTSCFSLASDKSDYQYAIGELFRGEYKIVYRRSEFSPEMKLIFDRYINEMDPYKNGVAEFGQPFSSGDVDTEWPRMRLAFAFTSKNVGAFLIQHGEGFGGHINIVVFDTTKNWYCYSDLGSDLSNLHVLNIEVILQDRINQRNFPKCERW